MPQNDKALQSFLIESDENLAQLEQDIVALEREPEDAERVASAFRAIHTIKGTCGFFGFSHLESLTHLMEDILGAMRDGQVQMNLDTAAALLEGVDEIRVFLKRIDSDGSDGEAAPQNLMDRLQSLVPEKADTQPSPVMAASDSDTDSSVTINHDETEQQHQTELQAQEHHEHADKDASASDNATTSGSAAAESTVRVDVVLLDKLMNVVGELVLTRNQLLQHAASQNDSQLLNLSQRLNLVTSELQEGLMQTRMQPIRNAWATYPRLLRDLEKKTGKKVTPILKGGDTELDRSLLEAIRDPLIHLVRNAVDHGIETPEARLAAGKPEAGTLTLSAYHESGNVTVEISDDGKGLDSQKIIRRALEAGLLHPDQVDSLSEREKIRYIFQPGFSTAETVNDLSGRGVGLDVVRNNVERIGGSIDIKSTPGQGTTFKLKIPLTLAIVPALIVRCLHQRFAIPQVNLMEVVYVEAERLEEDIQTVHDALVYRLRGRLLPLVDMRTLMHMGTPDKQHDQFILVLTADQQEFGLLVDDVRDTEEIVVKPLGRLLKDNPCFAGATIMGDGRVALILDVKSTADFAGVTRQDRKLNQQAAMQDQRHQPINVAENYLLVRPNDQAGRSAISLSKVSRLEEISCDRIEYSAGREVIQYRGKILPLIRLGNNRQPVAEESEMIRIVVQPTEFGEVGLVVNDIIDIVSDDKAEIEKVAQSDGIVGAGILQGHITDFIDSDALLRHYRNLNSNGGHDEH
ncbi:CheA signal transduction histidine kinase [Alcanivorax nanhaiticus]|uniref:Chemotaxis protein CheA n=1 Tax=Alcanivorax nanhaiticus TaxID=1177154 RepID=A0A095SPK4_9GAMM|nr:chemotaxis protein CheA [Alcanivorax nanhaiticus]KGD66517.1 CheA signal transduction histidine kinase [Alcanivorax nanhaiticus]